ncbi:MAG: hypothetical protein P1U36_09685, partial [Legionellaceae bacterium]|nr:hypothetical protein [Legionellaceae bacterium]
AYFDRLAEEKKAAEKRLDSANKRLDASKKEADASKKESDAVKQKLLKRIKKDVKKCIAAQLLILESREPSITQAQFVLDVVQAVLDDDDDEALRPELTVYAEELLSERTVHHVFFAPASNEGLTHGAVSGQTSVTL